MFMAGVLHTVYPLISDPAISDPLAPYPTIIITIAITTLLI